MFPLLFPEHRDIHTHTHLQCVECQCYVTEWVGRQRERATEATVRLSNQEDDTVILILLTKVSKLTNTQVRKHSS